MLLKYIEKALDSVMIFPAHVVGGLCWCSGWWVCWLVVCMKGLCCLEWSLRAMLEYMSLILLCFWVPGKLFGCCLHDWDCFAKFFQFSFCCCFILVLICLLSDWAVRTVSSVCGKGGECFVLSRVSMRVIISGTKSGLWTLRLSCRMCFSTVLFIM